MEKFKILWRNLDKRKRLMLLTIMASITLLLGTITYAFFTTVADNSKSLKANLTSANLALTFEDGDNGVNAQLGFNESTTKKFRITNKGTAKASLSLDWKELINTYLDGSLSYKLIQYDDANNETVIIEDTNMPTSEERLTQTLAGEISVDAGKTYNYDLVITLNNLPDKEQSADLSAVFNTKFDVGQPKKYRYYTLTVNPNGGTWNTHTTNTNYQLKSDETMDIPTPSRIGYDFTGWEVSAPTSTIKDGVYTMGISDTTLTATWKPKKYTLTIKPDTSDSSKDTTRTIDYLGTTEVENPSKTGHTFTGWTITPEDKGYFSGTTFTIKDSNVTITANYVPNTYRWIAYHMRQAIDGSYTLESATTDKTSGEAIFGTEVYPEFSSKDGFTNPSSKNKITIGVDVQGDDEIPVNNKTEYQYPRNKYTLTINNNGATTTREVLYQDTVNLNEIEGTKEGYTLTSFKKTSGNGIIRDNTFEMGLDGATIEAVYTANTYTITFNPNGGKVTTGSKTVTYDSTYGNLPTPTRTGYRFLGWYLTKEGTGEVTSSTPVTTTSNQTLYAGWQANNYKVNFELAGGSVSVTLPNNIDYDSTYELPTPTKVGHTFDHWSATGGEINPTTNVFTMNTLGDVTITAHYNANPYSYKIIHRKQNVDGNGYTEVTGDTITETASYGSEIPNNTVKTYEGFTSPAKVTKNISDNESDNIITYDYTRNQYTLTINTDNGVANTTEKMYYEATKTINNPTKTGYNFANWTKTGSGTMSGTTFKMGAGDTTLKATYTPKSYKYIVYHQKQNINDNNYTTVDTDSNLTANFGTTVTPAVKDTYGVGFTKPSPSGLTIGVDVEAGTSGTPTKNIKTYKYNRNSFNLTLDLDGGTLSGVTSPISLKYEKTYTLGTPTKTGYTFKNWTKTAGSDSTLTGSTFKMGTSAATVKATYTVNQYKYTIQHKTMNTDGVNYTVRETESSTSLKANYGSSVSGTPKSYTGFKAGSCNTKTIGTNEGSNVVVCTYERQKYTVTLSYPNSGVTISNKGSFSTGASGNILTDYYEKQITLPTLTRTGYTLSWSRTSGVGTIASSKFTIGAGSATVTGTWTGVKFTATFNPNGGNWSGSTANKTQQQTYGSKYVLPNEPTKSGYIFLGWFTSASGGTQVTTSTTVARTSAQTLYAQWIIPTLRAVNNYTSNGIWGYKKQITKVIIETNSNMNIPSGSISTGSMDTSYGNIISYLVANSDSISEGQAYTAYIKTSAYKIIANADSSWLFLGFNNLKVIEGLDKLDTSNVTNMSHMFQSCESLNSLDLRNWNTSKVTDMGSMFDCCYNLTSLNISSFDTSKVTDMGGMFYGCSSLASLNLSNFNTSKVTSMGSMFNACTSLTSLNLSNFDTSNVTSMSYMFCCCKSLTSLDLSKFNTSNVTSMSNMFLGCVGLTSLNVSGFNTSNVTSMSCMFNACKGLTSLNLSSFDTSKVTDMSYMFGESRSLKSIRMDRASFNNVTSDYHMFYGLSVNVYVKDATAKSFFEARRDSIAGNVTINIA